MERSYIPVLMLECCDPPTEGLESVLVNELAVGLRLRRAKDQAEDWLGAVWAALNQQRREQLLLYQRVKEEDDWAGRLQDRTESLVVELQVLEKETHAQQRIPETPDKETFRSLALLQQSRKHARQALSRQLARSRQVQGSLKEAETQQISLLEDLRPVRPMLTLS
eukprot:s2062_g13.t1